VILVFTGPVDILVFIGPVDILVFIGPVDILVYIGPVDILVFTGPVDILVFPKLIVITAAIQCLSCRQSALFGRALLRFISGDHRNRTERSK